MFCIAWVLLFGLAGSVLHFNRVPTLITAFARRWFALPLQHFFDDFRVLEPIIADGSAFKVFKLLDKVLGIRFDDAKDSTPQPVLELLGNLEDFTRTSAEDRIFLQAKPQRLADIKAEVLEVLAARHIPPGTAAPLRGKLLNIAQCRPSRLGRATLTGLNDAANACSAVPWNTRLELDLSFVLAALEPRIVVPKV